MPAPNRDADHLDLLRDHYARNRRIPSLQRIAELLGFDSKTAAHKLLQRLERAGFVERTPDGEAWIPSRRFFERPLAGAAVRAGAPEAIEAAAGEGFLVDDYLVRRPSATVLVPVKGDSMAGAGIHEGDLVVVERGATAETGDFVVAVVDGELTLKELGRERGRTVLIPRNPAYPVIRPEGELTLYGVVRGLIRRYRR